MPSRRLSGARVAERSRGATERTNTASTSSVRLDAMAAGAISDGPGGSTSQMLATVSQSGGSTSRAKQTVNSDDGTRRERSEATYAAEGDSSQSFSGTIDQDEQHRTSRSGTTMSSATGESDSTASYHAYSNDSSGPFPAFEIYTGAEGGTVNIFSNGFLESDHNAVSTRGSTNAKTTGDEESTYRTGSSNFSGDLTSFTWTWTNTTVVDGADSSSDATSDYEEEQDLTEEGQSDGESSAEDDSDGAGDQDDGSSKVTSQRKVIDQTGRVAWNGTTVSKYNRQDDTTTTTKAGGSKDQTSTAVEWTETFFSLMPGADPTTHNIRETGNQTRTFTTAGNQPGDEQKLEITREVDRLDTELTTYSEAQFADEPLEYVQSFFTYGYDRHKVVTETDESTNYQATHKLGADGRTAVGGKLSADHEKTVTTTTNRSGDVITSKTVGQTDWVTDKHEDVDKLRVEQKENSRYEGGVVVGGKAATTITTTSDLTIDAKRRLFQDFSSTNEGTHSEDYQLKLTDGSHETQWITDAYVDGQKETAKSRLGGQRHSEEHKSVVSDEGGPSPDHTITKNDHYTRHQVDGKIFGVEFLVDREWVHVWGDQSHGHHESPLDSPSPGTDPPAPWGPDWNKLVREYDDPEHEQQERYATRWDGEDSVDYDDPPPKPVVQQHQPQRRGAIRASMQRGSAETSIFDSIPNWDLIAAYPSEVLATGKGYFYDAPKEIVVGTAEAVLHPIQTAQGVGHAVLNPSDAVAAIKNDVVDKWNSGNAGKGQVFFEAVTSVLGLAKSGQTAVRVGNKLRRKIDVDFPESSTRGGYCFVAGTHVLLHAVDGRPTETQIVQADMEPSDDTSLLLAASATAIAMAGIALPQRPVRKRQSDDSRRSTHFSLDSGAPPTMRQRPSLELEQAVPEESSQPTAPLTNNNPTRQGSKFLRTAWLACWLSVAGLLAFSASRLNPQPTVNRTPGASVAAESSTVIEKIQVGDRVAGAYSEGELAGETMVDRATWRRLALRAESRWDDGTLDVVHISTLQSPEWVAEHRAAVGATVPLPLDLLEMGLPESLRATVVANEPCPILQNGPGRVVLTTVDHLNDDVYELKIRGSYNDAIQSLRTTGLHKFYRTTDREWVSARDLNIGDHLETPDGIATLAAVQKVPGVHRVYNLTVEGEHVYRVSTLGVLVHNNGCAGGATYSGSRRAALRSAKKANDIPLSAQPVRTIKPNTREGILLGLDDRNVLLYEYVNNAGRRIHIRLDKPTSFGSPGGMGDQGWHFNAGPAFDKLKQHHFYGN